MPRTIPASTKPYAAFGDLLRQLRLKSAMSQGEFAERAGVDPSYLSRLENGERRPSPKLLHLFAEVLDFPYSELAVASGLIDRSLAPRSGVTQQLQGRIDSIVGNRGAPVSGPQRRAIPVYDTVPAGVFKDANVVEAGDDVPQLVLSEEEVGYDPRAFALVVSGDSMVEAGILDGDILVVSPNTRVAPGDIAVVCVDRTATTVKKVYAEEDSILLQPCNSNFKPEVYQPKRVEILGKVILVRRKL